MKHCSYDPNSLKIPNGFDQSSVLSTLSNNTCNTDEHSKVIFYLIKKFTYLN